MILRNKTEEKRSLRADSGMTLIEAVVWIGMFTAVMVALMGSLLYFYRTNHYVLEEASATTSGQHGIDKLVRVIREASYSNNGAYPIISMGANQLSIYADIDNDTAVEKIAYYVQNTALYEDIVNPTGNPSTYTSATSTSDISDYVHNIEQGINTFTYYDKSGGIITDYTRVADVRFVVVNLIVDVNSNDRPGQLTLRSSAALRNIVTH